MIFFGWVCAPPPLPRFHLILLIQKNYMYLFRFVFILLFCLQNHMQHKPESVKFFSTTKGRRERVNCCAPGDLCQDKQLWKHISWKVIDTSHGLLEIQYLGAKYILKKFLNDMQIYASFLFANLCVIFFLVVCTFNKNSCKFWLSKH